MFENCLDGSRDVLRAKLPLLQGITTIHIGVTAGVYDDISSNTLAITYGSIIPIIYELRSL